MASKLPRTPCRGSSENSPSRTFVNNWARRRAGAATTPRPNRVVVALAKQRRLRHRCGFDFDQNVRMVKACDTQKRACLTAPSLCEAVFDQRPCLHGAIDVRGVEIQTGHIRHLELGILQNRFQVIQGLGYLSAHIPRMERVSLGVNGHLSRAIEDTPRVADLVRLDEPVLVLPLPRVDDPPFHNASFLRLTRWVVYS